MKIVITRHKALVEYLKELNLIDETTEVLSHATEDLVKGKTVIGVLPIHLAALTSSYINIPINTPPELRGEELTLEQVREFAQDPVEYIVKVAGDDDSIKLFDSEYFPSDVWDALNDKFSISWENGYNEYTVGDEEITIVDDYLKGLGVKENETVLINVNFH